MVRSSRAAAWYRRRRHSFADPEDKPTINLYPINSAKSEGDLTVEIQMGFVHSRLSVRGSAAWFPRLEAREYCVRSQI